LAVGRSLSLQPAPLAAKAEYSRTCLTPVAPSSCPLSEPNRPVSLSDSGPWVGTR
jgi:hypothetical protein